MRYSKIISNLLLFLLTISIIVYPQAGISTITVYAHPAPSEIKLQQDQLFSYESVLTLLEEIEDGALDKRCIPKQPEESVADSVSFSSNSASASRSLSMNSAARPRY